MPACCTQREGSPGDHPPSPGRRSHALCPETQLPGPLSSGSDPGRTHPKEDTSRPVCLGEEEVLEQAPWPLHLVPRPPPQGLGSALLEAPSSPVDKQVLGQLLCILETLCLQCVRIQGIPGSSQPCGSGLPLRRAGPGSMAGLHCPGVSRPHPGVPPAHLPCPGWGGFCCDP